MYGKIKRNTIIKIITCFFLILILGRFVFNGNISKSDASYLIDANLILNTLHQAKSQEIDLENKYQLTAIILHWERLSGVKRSIQYYLSTKLFKQIIVWNNNPRISLTINQLLPNDFAGNLVQIINSNENLKDEAKYRACAQAQTLACFYADDDWNVSDYTKSLIASFRSDPNVLHTATNVPTYYNNMLWTFMDAQIDLHAGFSWIATGSVFLREHAQRHLQLLKKILTNNQDLFLYSDLFFSIWLNDIPSQMIVNLQMFPTSSNEMGRAFSSAHDFGDLHYKGSVLAIRKLEYSLRLNQSHATIAFPRHRNRRFPYYVRAPSLTDDFIFFNNILPIDIERIPFDIALHADRGTYQNVPTGSNYEHFILHNTWKAVDPDERTCWRPNKLVRNGDFFAVDLLRIQANITLSLTVGHSEKLQSSLDMRISFDGIWWISYRSRKGIFKTTTGVSTEGFHRLVIDSKQFPPELRSFRYIAFNATHDVDEVFRVCEVKIIPNSAIILI